MMHYEHRTEGRIENVYHTHPNHQVYNASPVSQMDTSFSFQNLRYEYDILLYSLMEGNLMPFNRNITFPQEALTEDSMIEESYKSCSLEEESLQLGAEYQLMDIPSLIHSELIQDSLAKLQKYPFYEDVYNSNTCETEKDSDARHFSGILAHYPTPDTCSTSISTFPPVAINSPALKIPAQDTFNTSDLSQNPGLNIPEMEQAFPLGILEDPAKSAMQAPEETRQQDSGFEAPNQKKAKATTYRRGTRKRAKISGPNIKIECPSQDLTQHTTEDEDEDENTNPALPIECMSPIERWRLHCLKNKQPKIKNGTVQCPHCEMKFPDMEECVLHLQEVGFKQRNVCPDQACHFSIFGFKVRGLLRRHVCNDHLKRYNQKRMRSAHARKKDSPAVKVFLRLVYVCSHKSCLRAFYRSDSLSRHERLTHTKTQSPGSECDEGT